MANITLSQQVYFTKQEAAEYLRFSPRAIESLLARGELKAYRPRRKLLFRREDLDAFVQRHPIGMDVANLVDEMMCEIMVLFLRIMIMALMDIAKLVDEVMRKVAG